MAKENSSTGKANMKRVGFLLMSGGFLWGSFVAVTYLQRVEWTPYAIAFSLTAIGAVLYGQIVQLQLVGKLHVGLRIRFPQVHQGEGATVVPEDLP